LSIGGATRNEADIADENRVFIGKFKDLAVRNGNERWFGDEDFNPSQPSVILTATSETMSENTTILAKNWPGINSHECATS
jgi:hypothetical protein